MKTLEDIKNELRNELDVAVNLSIANDTEEWGEGAEFVGDFVESIKPLIEEYLDEAFELGKTFNNTERKE